MKIALVIFHADPARGGAERYTFDLAQRLAHLGHDISLLASSFGPALNGVKSVRISAPGLTRLGRYNRFLNAIDSHASDQQYDITHAMLPIRRCDVYHPHAGIAADAISAGHTKHAGPIRQRVARVFNQVNLKRNRFARVEAALLQGDNPPVVLCLSDYIKKALSKHYPLPADKLATLFNAVDLEKFDPQDVQNDRDAIRQQFQLSPGQNVMLMIAQDFERKGLSETLHAMAKSKTTDSHLIVVGKQDASPWKQLALQLNLQSRVTFVGPTTTPVRYYRAADFFILPTRHDPCSLVVLEALAMGLPVISTKQNGACEIMSPSHGFVINSADDQQALIHAMEHLCDPAGRTLRHQACLQLRPQLAVEAHVSRLLEIYLSILPKGD